MSYEKTREREKERERDREREREREQTKSGYSKFLALDKSDNKGQL